MVRRGKKLSGVCHCLQAGSFAGGRTTYAIPNLRGIEFQFGQGAAESIAMHAKFFSCLALVSLVLRQYFEDIPLLKLLHCFCVRDSGAMQLCHDSVKFALQGHLMCTADLLMTSRALCSIMVCFSIVTSLRLLDPIRSTVLELCGSVGNLLLKVMRYNEGYPMSTRKEIGS